LKNDSEKLTILSSIDLNEFKKFLKNLSKKTYFNFNTFGSIHSKNLEKISKYELIRKDKIKFFSMIGNNLIAYSFLTKFEKITKKHSCVLGIVIIDEWQNKGFGKKIVQHMIKTAWNKGYKKIWLTVFTDNLPALKIYKDLGFEIEGIFVEDEIIKNKKRDVVSMAIFKQNKKTNEKRTKIMRKIK